MTGIGNRRSTVVMYSDADALGWDGLSSHRVRLVLSDKDISTEIVALSDANSNAELLEINPQGACPTLIDRELALYDARVIIDYLDERYPHPPLMPIDPVSRARARLALHRIETDWYSLLPCSAYQQRTETQCQQELSEALTAANDVFDALPFFFSEDYSILDATLAPMLWRLPSYGIKLPESATAVKAYAKRQFERPAFIASLSDEERGMQ